MMKRCPSLRQPLPALAPVLLVALFALFPAAPPAGAVGVEEIPSPRPTGWSVDTTGTLPPSVLRDLDALGERVHGETGGELVVVVVDTVGGSDPRGFAVRLFNTWGIGSRERNDGVLVFMALRDRAAEIVLGDGLDGPAGQGASDRAMQREMVPRFRAGAIAEGLQAGARSLAREIFGVADAQAGRAAATVPVPETAPAPRVEQPPGAGASSPGRSPAQPRQAPPETPRRRAPVSVPLIPLLVGLGGLAGLVGLVALARRPSKCRSCRVRRIKLDEISEDAHLEPVERLEEEIGSVDHQVWVCPSCGDVMEVARRRWFSSYKTCSACHGRTWRSSERVVRYATTESEGLVQVDGWCVSCDHRTSHTRIIPKEIEWVDDDDDSYRRSSGSFFSSSSSSSGRSSSSSHSSFGGGHSSGGGSSGRW